MVGEREYKIRFWADDKLTEVSVWARDHDEMRIRFDYFYGRFSPEIEDITVK